MTDVQVFFNRPGKSAGITEAILADIRTATRFVAVASAWFTDDRIASAVIESRAKGRLVLLNLSDIERPGAHKTADLLLDAAFRAKTDNEWFFVGVLGDPNYGDGLMHHKFVVADDIVWTGSFNLTYQAGKNYENAVRLQSAAVAKQYSDEAVALLDVFVDRVQGNPA